MEGNPVESTSKTSAQAELSARLVAGTLAAVGAAVANAMRWVLTERMMRVASNHDDPGNNARGDQNGFRKLSSVIDRGVGLRGTGTGTGTGRGGHRPALVEAATVGSPPRSLSQVSDLH